METYVVATVNQVLAQVRADKASSTSDQHAVALTARLRLDHGPW